MAPNGGHADTAKKAAAPANHAASPTTANTRRTGPTTERRRRHDDPLPPLRRACHRTTRPRPTRRPLRPRLPQDARTEQEEVGVTIFYTPDVTRDRWGRRLVTDPRGGTKPLAYGR